MALFVKRKKQQNLPPDSDNLEESAKLLIRRDFELIEVNERYDQKLIEFTLLQEAILLANQIKDVRSMLGRLGQLLISRLNYDRYFIIEQVGRHYRPVTSLGFDDKPFEGHFSMLESSGLLAAMFNLDKGQILRPGIDQSANQIISILNTSSLALMPIHCREFQAVLVVSMDQPLDALDDEDLDFLNLLVNQLQVIIDNINSFLQLARQNEELRALDKAKTMFLSIASHQLRTPLTVFKFALSVLQKPDTGPLTQKQQEIVGEMVRNNNRITNLVNDLLNITRLQQGRLSLNLESIPLNQLIRSIFESLSELIVAKKITVSIDVPNIVVLEGDRVLLREALTNLISNGVKYNREGGRLTVTARQTGREVVITVADTGIGIPRDEQSKVFTQFYRSQQATTIDPEGVGLGLYTSQQFILLHHGQIGYTSVPNEGTTFTVSLPDRQDRH